MSGPVRAGLPWPLLALVAASCAGGRMLVVADRIEQPVSATDAVFGADGAVLSVRGGRLRVVHHFAHELRQWTLMWTLVALTKEVRDLSEVLAREIELHHGQGVVNLTVTGGIDPFWLLTSLVPILPSHFDVVVEGDVFQVVEPER